MYYKIDGDEMLSIVSFEGTPSDMYAEESTGRDEVGYMHLDLVRPNVHSWKLGHKWVPDDEYKRLRDALNPLGFLFEGWGDDGYVTAQCYGRINKSTVDFIDPDGTVFRSFDLVVTEL